HTQWRRAKPALVRYVGLLDHKCYILFLGRVIMAMKSSMSTNPSWFLSISFTIFRQSSRLQLSPSLRRTSITSSAVILPSLSLSNTKKARRMSPSWTPFLCTSMNSSRSM
uniref:Uncharacterized protein n=1 Tax=Aegilops tauschii subsp. strangulata TaxID=200361 RepID=A0A453KZN0_AEGTS